MGITGGKGLGGASGQSPGRFLLPLSAFLYLPASVSPRLSLSVSLHISVSPRLCLSLHLSLPCSLRRLRPKSGTWRPGRPRGRAQGAPTWNTSCAVRCPARTCPPCSAPCAGWLRTCGAPGRTRVRLLPLPLRATRDLEMGAGKLPQGTPEVTARAAWGTPSLLARASCPSGTPEKAPGETRRSHRPVSLPSSSKSSGSQGKFPSWTSATTWSPSLTLTWTWVTR